MARTRKVLLTSTLALLALSTAIVAGSLDLSQIGEQDIGKERLAYFIGEWADKGDRKPTATNPGGPFEGTMTFEASPHKNLIVFRHRIRDAQGETTELGIIRFDQIRRVYELENDFDRNPDPLHFSIRLDHATWILETDATPEVRSRARWTMIEVSPSEFTHTYEVLPDGGSWRLVSEGRASRVR